MTKQTISRILIAVLIVSNIYLVWRVNSNTMAISSYDAGISQRSGVGRLESFWTKYIGGSKNLSSYADRERAEADNKTVTDIFFIMDIVLVGAIYFLNKKPKPKPVVNEDEEWRKSRRSRRRR